MILIGRDLSPFTRRVAISLELLGHAVERRLLSTATDADEIRRHNPLGRVPALVLEDGETLIDSAAILDYLDELAGDERALTPKHGPERRLVMKLTAIAQGVMDKAVAAFYERTRRPQDKQHPPWLEMLEGQVAAGLQALEDALPDKSGWLALGRMTQADVSAVAAFDFAALTCPHPIQAGAYANLRNLSQRLNDLPAFARTKPRL